MEVLILVCGVLIGVFVTALFNLRLRAGVLYVVRTHLEDTPQTLLELDYPIDTLTKKKYVLLKVDYISTRK